MIRYILSIFSLIISLSCLSQTKIFFNTTAPGVTKTLDFWGVDQTWVSNENMSQSINNMGADEIDVVRIEFPMTDSLKYVNGVPTLLPTAYKMLDDCMAQATRVPNAKLTMQQDNTKGEPNPNIGTWYLDGSNKIIPKRWVDAIEASINYVNSKYGYNMSDWYFIEVFNEPDWEWSFGSKNIMLSIMTDFKSRPTINSIPLLGPSTLSSANAQAWWDVIKTKSDIGGCHVINGSMASFKNYVKGVHSQSKKFINPEIHTLVEIMIHADLSTGPGEGGMWWGGCQMPEAQFMQACKGKRLAYFEDPDTWSVACVYRDLNGDIWLFASASERNSTLATYTFECEDRDVYFDGVAPGRTYTLTIGGGTGHAKAVKVTTNGINTNELTNVALSKTVTVDSYKDNAKKGPLAVDGNHTSETSRWVSTENGYPHWIQVDLLQTYEISALRFWTGYMGYNIPVYDFKFQGWNGSGWFDIITEVGNNTGSYLKTFQPVRTNKVRLYGTAGQELSMRLYEIEVYGKTPTSITPTLNDNFKIVNNLISTNYFEIVSSAEKIANLKIFDTKGITISYKLEGNKVYLNNLNAGLYIVFLNN